MGTLSVTAEVKKTVNPDAISFSTVIVSEDTDKEKALQKHIALVNKLKKEQIDNICSDVKVKTGTISISEQKDSKVIKKTEGFGKVSTTSTQETVGYRTESAIIIEYSDISDTELLIKTANLLLSCKEATSISAYSFIKDPKDIQLKLRTEVGKEAKEQANSIATPMGYKITGIDSISYNMPQGYRKSSARVSLDSLNQYCEAEFGCSPMEETITYAEGIVQSALEKELVFEDSIVAVFIVE